MEIIECRWRQSFWHERMFLLRLWPRLCWLCDMGLRDRSVKRLNEVEATAGLATVPHNVTRVTNMVKQIEINCLKVSLFKIDVWNNKSEILGWIYVKPRQLPESRFINVDFIPISVSGFKVEQNVYGFILRVRRTPVFCPYESNKKRFSWDIQYNY